MGVRVRVRVRIRVRVEHTYIPYDDTHFQIERVFWYKCVMEGSCCEKSDSYTTMLIVLFTA
jgi:hypothetical protein